MVSLQFSVILDSLLYVSFNVVGGFILMSCSFDRRVPQCLRRDYQERLAGSRQLYLDS